MDVITVGSATLGESALGSDSSATGTSSACDSVRGALGSLVELAQPHVHDAGANRGLELAGVPSAIILP
jgi:hypothetical protein